MVDYMPIHSYWQQWRPFHSLSCTSELPASARGKNRPCAVLVGIETIYAWQPLQTGWFYFWSVFLSVRASSRSGTTPRGICCVVQRAE